MPTPSDPALASRQSSSPATLWIVDDSPLQARMALEAMPADYRVEIFSEGAAMLEALASGRSPEVLILDWHMPRLSGLEVCAFVRQTRDAGHLPILVLTASGTPVDLVQALEAGANDFVMKPFHPAELQARTAALLRNKLLHAKLAETERRLRVEGEFREGFIGMLAHDLRQPLSTFTLVNQTLTNRRGADVGRLLEMQRRTADRMSRMVTELLDLARSRPETGMPVDRRPCDLAALAGELLEEIRVAHPAHVFELDVQGSCEGSWDSDRIVQLCGNLLGNAVEHGAPTSPITLRIRGTEDAVVLSVSNEGEPIPPDTVATIFDPFSRGRGASARTAGAGLGLHIVSAIARAHQGEVHVRSDRAGTVFEVTLPRVGSPA